MSTFLPFFSFLVLARAGNRSSEIHPAPFGLLAWSPWFMWGKGERRVSEMVPQLSANFYVIILCSNPNWFGRDGRAIPKGR